MTNSINGNKPPMERLLTETQRGQGKGRVDAPPGPERGLGNSAVEGTQSERLQALLNGIKQTPDVDMGRVEALKQKIANGEYPMDADKIASRFVELEQMLEG